MDMKSLPEGWGQDNLTGLFDAALDNTFRTITHLPDEIGRLRKLTDRLQHAITRSLYVPAWLFGDCRLFLLP